MNTKVIVTPGGERVVMLAEGDYEALLAAAEDGADLAAVAEFRRRLAAGEEELVPSEVVDRILAGENRVRVWRNHRNLTARDLAGRAGIDESVLGRIEDGQHEDSVDTLRRLADALSVTLDDLVG